MKYKDYRWFINDSLTSVDRMLRIAPELKQFFHSEYLERYYTRKFGDLEVYYLDTLNDIKFSLENLKHFRAATINKYHNASLMLKTVNSIVQSAYELTQVYFDLKEMLEEDNFHSESRILKNESDTIFFNMTRIRDSFPDMLWR